MEMEAAAAAERLEEMKAVKKAGWTASEDMWTYAMKRVLEAEHARKRYEAADAAYRSVLAREEKMGTEEIDEAKRHERAAARDVSRGVVADKGPRGKLQQAARLAKKHRKATEAHVDTRGERIKLARTARKKAKDAFICKRSMCTVPFLRYVQLFNAHGEARVALWKAKHDE